MFSAASISVIVIAILLPVFSKSAAAGTEKENVKKRNRAPQIVHILDAGGYHIISTDQKLSWENAHVYCNDQGGRLAQPSDAAKNIVYEDLLGLNAMNGPYWIGLNDETTEGILQWSDGSNATYTDDWLFSTSRNSEKNNCAYLKYVSAQNDYKWAFGKCSKKNYFLCEVPLTCGTRSIPADRIVGGTNSSMGSWPWQVILEGPGHHCGGGVIIDQHWILTAAHCVSNYISYPRILNVRMGIVSLSGTSEHEYTAPVSYIAVHPLHTLLAPKDRDFALLYVDAPIPFSNYIRPVCLPEPGDDCFFNPVGRACAITGWGSVAEGSLAASDMLQEGIVQTLRQDYCSIRYDDLLTNSMLCAGLPGDGVDSCLGDSGNPLVCQMNDGMWYLAGLVSWGTGCADSFFPGVYSRITAANDWIRTTIEKGPTICGTRVIPEDRIVGGSDASPGSWPWQVTVLVASSYLCGGVIIDEHWILTAAHCIYNETGKATYASKDVFVIMGDTSLYDWPPNKYAVDGVGAIYMHDYPGEHDIIWDFALLYVDDPLPYSEYIRPVCLPTTEFDNFFQAGEECVATGFGQLGDNLAVPEQLQQAVVTILGDKLCHDILGEYYHKSELCAKSEKENTGTCFGDSGGPLVCKKADGRWYLAGLTSWLRQKCANPYYPSGFARITAVDTWIKDIMTNHGV